MEADQIKQDDQNILVLTDFGSCARHAADHAILLGEALNANIVLFNSYFMPNSAYDNQSSESHNVLIGKSKANLEKEANRMRMLIESHQAKYKPMVTAFHNEGTLGDNAQSIAHEKTLLMVIMGGQSNNCLLAEEITHLIDRVKLPIVIVPEPD
ncbi:universal stress protein [Pedobacter sp. ASV28]|uniref:universal stress protein n=1 Tax=Pedobacter sp. ASV28 TaxID=2795123 RepID=UPI0018EC659B|nr:universal stress protein [Pedobacter sp. ASV28]